MTADSRSQASHRLLRDWWHEVTTIRPSSGAPWAAIRVGIAVTVPLAVLLAIGRPDWTAYAVFGSISTVYSKHDDYAARFRAQAGTGLTLTLAVVLGIVAGILGPGSFWAVAAMTILSVLGYLLAREFGWLPVPSLFMVFAAGAISSYQHAWSDLPIAIVLSALAALFGAGLGQLGRLVPKSGRGKVAEPLRTPLRDLLSAPGVRIDMASYALGPLLAGSVATIIGISHPYWAAVSATVPLSGTVLAAQMARASLRLGGTIAGIGIAFAIMSANPPAAVLVLAVAVCQIFTELFVARNYGIAVIGITPLALILTRLAAPSPLVPLLTSRVVETLLGVVVAIIVLFVVRHSRTPRRAKAA